MIVNKYIIFYFVVDIWQMWLEGYSSLDTRSLKKIFVQLCKSGQAQEIVKHQYVKRYQCVNGRFVMTKIAFVRLLPGLKYEKTLFIRLSSGIERYNF